MHSQAKPKRETTFFLSNGYNFRASTLFSRSELLTTDTELIAIAAAANTGLRKIPKKG